MPVRTAVAVRCALLLVLLLRCGVATAQSSPPEHVLIPAGSRLRVLLGPGADRFERRIRDLCKQLKQLPNSATTGGPATIYVYRAADPIREIANRTILDLQSRPSDKADFAALHDADSQAAPCYRDENRVESAAVAFLKLELTTDADLRSELVTKDGPGVASSSGPRFERVESGDVFLWHVAEYLDIQAREEERASFEFLDVEHDVSTWTAGPAGRIDAHVGQAFKVDAELRRSPLSRPTPFEQTFRCNGDDAVLELHPSGFAIANRPGRCNLTWEVTERGRPRVFPIAEVHVVGQPVLLVDGELNRTLDLRMWSTRATLFHAARTNAELLRKELGERLAALVPTQQGQVALALRRRIVSLPPLSARSDVVAAQQQVYRTTALEADWKLVVPLYDGSFCSSLRAVLEVVLTQGAGAVADRGRWDSKCAALVRDVKATVRPTKPTLRVASLRGGASVLPELQKVPVVVTSTDHFPFANRAPATEVANESYQVYAVVPGLAPSNVVELRIDVTPAPSALRVGIAPKFSVAANKSVEGGTSLALNLNLQLEAEFLNEILAVYGQFKAAEIRKLDDVGWGAGVNFNFWGFDPTIRAAFGTTASYSSDLRAFGWGFYGGPVLGRRDRLEGHFEVIAGPHIDIGLRIGVVYLLAY